MRLFSDKLKNAGLQKRKEMLIYKELKNYCINSSPFYGHLHKEMKSKLDESKKTRQNEGVTFLSRKDEFNIVLF